MHSSGKIIYKSVSGLLYDFDFFKEAYSWSIEDYFMWIGVYFQ